MRVTEQNVIKDEPAHRFVQEYTWSELPLDLYMSEGDDHVIVQPVGSITDMWVQNDVVYASGRMRSDDSPYAVEARARLDQGVQRFVSMKARNATQERLQVLDNGVWVDVPEGNAPPEGMEYRLFIESVKIARVDMVSIPANETSVIEKWDGETWEVTDKFPAREETVLPQIISASGVIPRFPRSWVEKQKYVEPTKLVLVEDNGWVRFTGHYTMKDSCHRGFGGCKTPPKNAMLVDERGHGWGKGSLWHEDGSVTQGIGPVTIGKHYHKNDVKSYEDLINKLEDVTEQVGWCAYYEDEFGIQLQGVLAKDLSESDLMRIASSRPSVVWAERRGKRPIVAAVTFVTSEGFDQGFTESIGSENTIIVGEPISEGACCTSCASGGVCNDKSKVLALKLKLRKRKK